MESIFSLEAIHTSLIDLVRQAVSVQPDQSNRVSWFGQSRQAEDSAHVPDTKVSGLGELDPVFTLLSNANITQHATAIVIVQSLDDAEIAGQGLIGQALKQAAKDIQIRAIAEAGAAASPAISHVAASYSV